MSIVKELRKELKQLRKQINCLLQDIFIPKKTSDLINDGENGTSVFIEAQDLAEVATTGNYNDLENLPEIPDETSDITNNGENGTSRYIEENELAEVAITGDYADLQNTPTIPTSTAELNNNGENGTDPFITLNEVPDVPEYTLSPISGSNTVDLLKDGISISQIDLTPYLDDTNLSRLIEGTLDPQTGILTVTRDDNSTFTIDLSALIDVQFQSDWEEEDINSLAYIKNKPETIRKTSEITVTSNGHGCFLRNDGMKLFYCRTNGILEQFNLSKPFDLSTAVSGGTTTITGIIPVSMYIKPEGDKLYITGDSADDVYEYDLNTAWDITTISSLVNSYNPFFNTMLAFDFKEDGSSFFLANSSTIVKFDLSTPWDLSTVTTNTNVLSQSINPVDDFSFGNGGYDFYIGGRNSNIEYWTLLKPYDLSTATRVGIIDNENSLGISGTPNKGHILSVRGTTLKMYVNDYSQFIKLPSSSSFSLEIQDENGTPEFNVDNFIQFGERFSKDVVNKKIDPVTETVFSDQENIFEFEQKFLQGLRIWESDSTISKKNLLLRSSPNNVETSNARYYDFVAYGRNVGPGWHAGMRFISDLSGTGEIVIAEFNKDKVSIKNDLEVLGSFIQNFVNLSSRNTHTIIEGGSFNGINYDLYSEVVSPFRIVNYRNIATGGAGWGAIHRFLVQSNGGSLINAFEVKKDWNKTDAEVNINGILKTNKLDLSQLGTFADDSAASTGGVAIGFAYINSATGALQRRLT